MSTGIARVQVPGLERVEAQPARHRTGQPCGLSARAANPVLTRLDAASATRAAPSRPSGSSAPLRGARGAAARSAATPTWGSARRWLRQHRASAFGVRLDAAPSHTACATTASRWPGWGSRAPLGGRGFAPPKADGGWGRLVGCRRPTPSGSPRPGIDRLGPAQCPGRRLHGLPHLHGFAEAAVPDVCRTGSNQRSSERAERAHRAASVADCHKSRSDSSGRASIGRFPSSHAMALTCDMQ